MTLKVETQEILKQVTQPLQHQVSEAFDLKLSLTGSARQFLSLTCITHTRTVLLT